MKKVNCITINTDASFSLQHKVGGYAFYIVCDYFKIQKSGMFKVQPKNSLEAEMMCMANALAMLSFQKDLPMTNFLVINSDALFAFDKIGHRKAGVGKEVAKWLSKARKATMMPRHEFRHVKAHNGAPDARSWVNEWCDREAKKWMRKAKERLKKPPGKGDKPQ